MKVKKMLSLIIWILIFMGLILIWFILKQDYKNYEIDRHNFEQLKKAKVILDQIPKDLKKFYTLQEFNEEYNAWIEPIKNCFYIKTENWKYSYIFWFKLESIIYKIRYLKINYSYPKYDVEPRLLCMQWFWCEDLLMKNFIDIISNPCKE